MTRNATTNLERSYLIDDDDREAIPLLCLSEAELDGWLDSRPAEVLAFAKQRGFTAARGEMLEGAPDGITLLGTGESSGPETLGALAAKLHAGSYRILNDWPSGTATDAAIQWAMGAYRFDAYRTCAEGSPRLCWPAAADRASVSNLIEAANLARDLINRPANEMGPDVLAEAAATVAQSHGAICTIIEEAALQTGFPAIHAVGRGSANGPRLVDIRHGPETAPRVTLVGKGITFDSGGLTLKNSTGMALMKKDMGGAAHALALGQMLMRSDIPLRLRILLPLAENMVSGDAMRPGDILRTRKGLTVEVRSTDAEGRLVLADALYEACGESPDLLIDFATLTSAARVALGPSISALFSNDDVLAAELLESAEITNDPMWRLPLWQQYRQELERGPADLVNYIADNQAGAIYAALFLQYFVKPDVPWAHLDIYAWNNGSDSSTKPGACVQGLRAVYDVINRRFGRG